MGSLLVIIASVAYVALLLYFFVMWGRFVLDLVRSFQRQWRPQGAVLVLAERRAGRPRLRRARERSDPAVPA